MADNPLAVSSIAERQAPALMRTANLVYNLQLCTLYTTTREAARIRLNDSSTVASALNVLANDGLEALVEANQSLNDIRYTAHSIAEPTGILDTLIRTFGRPEGTKTFDRNLALLQDQVDQCSASCVKLNDTLQSWKTDINDFRVIAQTTKQNEESAAGDLREDIEFQEHNLDEAITDLEHFQYQECEAQHKHDRAVSRLQPLQIRDHMPTSWDVGTMLLSSVSMGYAYWSSTVADRMLQKTQREVDRRRAEATEYERQIEQARRSLATATQKSAKLDDYLSALAKTLRALELITNDVRAVAVDFNEMKTAMKMVVDSKEKRLGRIIDDATVQGPSKDDIGDFVSSARKMQNLALVIEHLAWLYADIIKNVLMTGFQGPQADSTNGFQQSHDDSTSLITIGDANRSAASFSDNTSIALISTRIDQAYRDSQVRLYRTMTPKSSTSLSSNRVFNRRQEIQPTSTNTVRKRDSIRRLFSQRS